MGSTHVHEKMFLCLHLCSAKHTRQPVNPFNPPELIFEVGSCVVDVKMRPTKYQAYLLSVNGS